MLCAQLKKFEPLGEEITEFRYRVRFDKCHNEQMPYNLVNSQYGGKYVDFENNSENFATSTLL